jgi:hypothetical protein
VIDASPDCRAARFATPGGHLGVRQLGGDRLDTLDLGPHAGVGGALALGEHDGEALALGAPEALEVAVDDLGLGARDLEAAARQVLGLLRGEGRRGDEEDDPGAEDDEASPLEEGRQLVHGGLHLEKILPGWLASQLVPDAGSAVCDERHT